jgi:uncharacterized protein YjgD (DUF1641 family)
METQIANKMDERSQEELADLLSLVALLRGYLNDHVIKDLAETMASLSKLATAMAGTDLVNILERSLQDPELDRALLNPPKVGSIGLMRAMGDADVQRGMGIMLQLLRAVGKASISQ